VPFGIKLTSRVNCPHEYYNCQWWAELVCVTSLPSTDRPMNNYDSSRLLSTCSEILARQIFITMPTPHHTTVGVVICLERGANDLHMVQLMPLPPIISCFIKIQNSSAFLVPAYVVLEKGHSVNVIVDFDTCIAIL